jgi:hypothetical protein
MTARTPATIRAITNKGAHRDCQGRVQPQVRLTALLTVGLLAALIFGIIVLAGGDWIPGTVIVAASLIGLGRQIAVIKKALSAGAAVTAARHADRLTPARPDPPLRDRTRFGRRQGRRPIRSRRGRHPAWFIRP